MKKNQLLYGDNLSIMKEMSDKSVDLIYLDPPFNSMRTYNLMYKTKTGNPVSEQAEAFSDTWEMDTEKEDIIKGLPDLMGKYGIESEYINFWAHGIVALKKLNSKLIAYLLYMFQRLMEMKRILKPTGSIYLHCDPTASHYIKIMMDSTFGSKNFRNEIIWRRSGAHNSSTKWAPIHDVILFYSSSKKFTWNFPKRPYMKGHVDKNFLKQGEKTLTKYYGNVLTGPGSTKGESGKQWKGFNPTMKNRHWAISAKLLNEAGIEKQNLTQHEKLDALYKMGFIKIDKNKSWPIPQHTVNSNEGSSASDIWAYQPYTEGIVFNTHSGIDADVSWVKSNSKDHLGYPTQKPIGLLKRIIAASSNEGDLVFDPFCGCGTTIYAAHELKRRWIGCDIATLSVTLVRKVLTSKYGLNPGIGFYVEGIPVSVEQAKVLFDRSPIQFQHWLVEKVGGFPNKKTVRDQGVDGRIYFYTSKGLKNMVLSVKGGNINPSFIRELRGVLDRENESVLAGFLCLKDPSKKMLEEASSLGNFEDNGRKYARLQILSVSDIFEKKKEFCTPNRSDHKHHTNQPNLPL